MEQGLLRDLFCFQCSLQFNGKSVYDLHQSLVHGSKDLKMKKEIKSEKSDPESSNNAKTNKQSPFLPVDKELKGNHCNAGFPSQSHLNRHVESEFRKGHRNEHIESVYEAKKQFKCDICNYSCSIKKTMKTHVASVHKGKKPFKCNDCDKVFFLKGSLKTHIDLVHEGKKPFKCNVCQVAYSRQGNLKKHIVSVH